ncbi:putative Voltage-dependent calcium channel type D subunit alpha-1 [Daphnia magna]|uniref:Putative Voltage-dependent calcium channel type D subunit alpha-1 n=1 Tax=Daphnia magna TaxID=35525 RepID=A0A162D7Z6_9CRUS|nr:putative Voltage-dependent calcium channel type D subunit alpha-1 [Daphnia magna]
MPFYLMSSFFFTFSYPNKNKNPAGVYVGARYRLQYYKQSVLYKETLHYMNTAFTALFSIECMLKIISFGVRVSRSSAMLSKRKLTSLHPPPSTHFTFSLLKQQKQKRTCLIA